MKTYATCLSIAGSDPSGGAGLQADLKTFTLLGAYGQAVPTALTVQNSQGVQRSVPVEPALVRDQLEAVLGDLPPQAVKIGMLPTAEVAEAVAGALERHRPPFVVMDPVMVSSSGYPLVADECVEVMRQRLMPLCSLLTPNLPEVRLLLRSEAVDQSAMARRLSEQMRGTAVLVKGGHLEGQPVDVLYDGELYIYKECRVDTPNTHGTGCVLSSAIAAHVARGASLPEAVGQAKAFLTRALRMGADYFAGKGAGAMYLLPPSELPEDRS